MATIPQKERIGVVGTTFTIVGFVLGATIFVLPAELASSAGPAVFIGFLLAGIPAFFSCFIAAQLGNLFPTSGAGYIGAATVLSPFWGFIIVWNIIIAMVVGIPAVAYTFAKYLAYFPMFAEWDQKLVACSAVLVFGLVNLFGVKAVAWMQAVMISIYIVVLTIFDVGALFHADWSLLDPLFPPEIEPMGIFEAAVVATFTFGGFVVIAEMGDDIKDPKRTIPIALILAFVSAGFLYVVTSLVVPAIIPWQELGALDAPVSVAALTFLPEWFGTLIALSALLGAATSINAWLLTQSRDVYALARDKVLPKFLAYEGKRNRDPVGAMVFATLLVTVSATMEGSVTEYAMITALCVMFIYAIVSFVVLFSPKRVPELYARAEFKLGRFGIPFFSIGFLLISIVFFSVGALGDTKSFLVFVALLVPGGVLYFIRKAQLRAQGIEIKELLAKDLTHILQRDRDE